MVNAEVAEFVLMAMGATEYGLIVLARATAAVLVVSVPAFAQSNTRSSATAARQYVPASHDDTEPGAPPSNFIIAPSFRPTVTLMLRRSQTFRRQCQRLANAPHLTVALRRAGWPMPGRVRARTQMARGASGSLTAVIDVPAMDDDVELIAHELEHVIEQLDDVDLVTAASRTDSGVVVFARDEQVFETRRATEVGRRVALEVRRTGP